jgi:SNF2 family DNA or RNA helicase
MTFRDFVKRRSINEEVAINTDGASFITLDGSRSTDERQSLIDEFSEDLNKLSSDGQLVIALAVALD